MGRGSRFWPAALCLSLACGQGSLANGSRPATAAQIADDPSWVRVSEIELVRQRGPKDCGAAALSSVLEHWRNAEPASERPPRVEFSRDAIDAALRKSPEQGLAAAELRDYARARGFSAYVFRGTLDDLKHEVDAGRPVIVGVYKPVAGQRASAHYEVVIGYHSRSGRMLTLDPARGLQQHELPAFQHQWDPAGRVTLVVFPKAPATKNPSAAESQPKPAPPAKPSDAS